MIVDVETGELVEPELLPAVIDHDYRPTLVLAPEAAGAMVDQLVELQRTVLKAGTDYGLIPGTPKPSLFKPGAERLLQVFGLGHRMERMEVERSEDGNNTGVWYRCVVTRSLPDREVVVASCEAYASRDEAKWVRAPWNTIIKMAQKRALVGAALTACGASGLFTQDVEDYEQRSPERHPNRVAAESEPEYPAGEEPWASDAQIRKLMVMYKEHGVEHAVVQKELGASLLGFTFDSHKNLTKRQASELIDKLGELP